MLEEDTQMKKQTIKDVLCGIILAVSLSLFVAMCIYIEAKDEQTIYEKGTEIYATCIGVRQYSTVTGSDMLEYTFVTDDDETFMCSRSYRTNGYTKGQRVKSLRYNGQYRLKW